MLSRAAPASRSTAGLFNLIAGIWMLAQGIDLRRTGETLHPAHSPHREKNPA